MGTCQRSRRTGAVVIAAALFVGACGGDDAGPATSATTRATPPTAVAGADAPTTALAADASVPSSDGGSSLDPLTVDWAREFVGGSDSPPVGEPYRIGFAHSSDFFPDGDVAIDAVARFVNEQLGGVDGRPLELARCNMAAPEDGARCGAEFANDDAIDLVIGGSVLAGNADLYGALAGNAAAIIALPLDASDYVSPHAVAYNMGALGAGLGGAAFLAEDLQPETAALVVTDDVAGRAANEAFRPFVEAAGIELRQVFVSPTATSAEIAGALQATRASEADVLVVGLFESGCIATFDALRSLGIDPPVMTNAPCWGPGMRQHVSSVIGDDVPDGWYFGWFGYRPFGSDLQPGIAAMNDVMATYGDASVLYGLVAAPIWEALLIGVRVLNEIGSDADLETLEAAVRGYDGPAVIQSGPIACGTEPFIAVCASEASIVQYTAGEWVGVRSGEDDDAIDLAPYLG